jgi:hypothetical protein
MYLEEALEEIRRDGSKEMTCNSWACWYSLEGLTKREFNTSQLVGNSFRIREKAIKEVTMADLEEKYGCKVKVINK